MTTSADDVTPETDDIPSRKPRVRMSGSQRREQLVAVGRKLFAAKGYEAVSVEEIAAKAEVSKPVVYEHFGGKEGLYAVIVDREVTGLIETIMDALIRYQRMLGKNTLWQVGTDHAGIATQMVVERKIAAEEGKTRHDYGREAFIDKIWQWKEESGGTITRQMRRLAA